MIRRWIVGGLAMCWLAAAAAEGPQQPAQNASTQVKQTSAATPAKATNATMVTRGELKFQQNCNRCHNAPQELSPRISETVVMHMRVRASLSEADAKAILQYLAP